MFFVSGKLYKRLLTTRFMQNELIKYTLEDLKRARYEHNPYLVNIIKAWLEQQKQALKTETTNNIKKRDNRIRKHLQLCADRNCLEQKLRNSYLCEKHLEQRRAREQKIREAEQQTITFNKLEQKGYSVETKKMEFEKVNEVPTDTSSRGIMSQMTINCIEQFKNYKMRDIIRIPVKNNFDKGIAKKMANKYASCAETASKYVNKTVKVNIRQGDVYVTVVADFWTPKVTKKNQHMYNR